MSLSQVAGANRERFCARLVVVASFLGALIMHHGVVEAKSYNIRGLVDCGRDDVQFCRVSDDIYIWTEDLGEGRRKVLVDFSWIPNQIPRLSQNEFVEIEIDEIAGDYIVQRVVAQSDPPPKPRRVDPAPQPTS